MVHLLKTAFMTNHPATTITAFLSHSTLGVISGFAAKLLFWLCLIFPVFLLQAEQAKSANELKLIVLAPDLVELLYSLDAGSQIIASSEHADYPEAAKTLPRVGNYAGLSLEKIVSLQPDLILYWQNGTPVADVERLQALGLKLESFENKTLDDIAKNLLRLGALTGRTEKAEQLATAFRARLQAITTAYSNKTSIPLFYEIWDNPLSTISGQAWPAQHLRLCGAQNIINTRQNPYPQVSVEQVITANPWLIVQPVSKNEPRTLFQWQTFTGVKAVKYQQFAQPNSDLLHRASLRTLTGVQELCHLIDNSRQFYAQVIRGVGR